MDTLKTLAQSLLPAAAYNSAKRFWLSHEARQLRGLCERERSLEGVVDRVLESVRFRPDQKKAEITPLLRLLQSHQPRRLCEIGGRVGGSLAMFAHVARGDARILSIDLDYKVGQKEALSAFARDGQHIVCMAADSHVPATLEQVRTWLSGEGLDFLLIDGDHSYEGARLDFEMYAPLVKAGGLVAFHDVVSDFKTRTGVDTGAYAGGVPILWTELKQQGYRVDEFVESWDQDGFGIGLIHWDGIRRDTE